MHEALESRYLLAFDGITSLFSTTGNVAVGNPSELSLRFTGGNDSAVLGFLVTASDSSANPLDPTAVSISRDGTAVSSLRSFPDVAGTSQSFAVAELPLAGPTDYQFSLGGENATSGDFQLDVFLMGDLDSDGQVNDLELLRTTAAVTQYAGAGNLVTQTYYQQYGIDFSQDQRREQMDSDLDNDVDGFDLTQVEINHGNNPISVEVADGLEVSETFTFVDMNNNGRPDVGETVTFTTQVTNVGSTPLTDVGVTDAINGPLPVTDSGNNGPTVLAPGETESATSTRIITATDVATGTITTNTTATGTPPGRPPIAVTPPPETTTPIVIVSPSLQAATSFTLGDQNGDGRADAGETINYQYTVTNNGDDPLTNVQLSDDVTGVLVLTDTAGDGVNVLAPGATETASAVHTISTSEFATGALINTATAVGTPTVGNSVSATATGTVDFILASISVDKSFTISLDANNNGRLDQGDQVTYQYMISNTGEASLSSLSLIDDVEGAIGLPATTIAPNATLTASSQPHTVTAAELASGSLTNIATVTGVPSAGSAVSATDSVTIVFTQPNIAVSSSVALTSDVDQDGRADVGDQLTYTYVINNSGDAELTGITASDSFGTVAGATNSLQPGTTTTRTQVHTITAGEVTAGSLINTINVAGTPTVGTAVTGTSNASFTFVSPAIAVAKTVSLSTDVNGNGRPDTGDQLTNTYTITNSGDTPLSSLTLQDSLVTAAITVPGTQLAVGASQTATATQDVTAADVAAGVLNGTVVATGTPSVGTDVSTTINSTVDFSTFQVASVSVATTSTLSLDVNANGRVDQGDQVTYSFLITNTGDVDLSALSLTTTVENSIPLSQTTLASSATLQATSQPHTVTAAELATGSLANVATVSAMPPSGTTITGTDTLTINFIQPAISVTSSVALTTDNNQNGRADSGDLLTYSYAISNSGDSVLTNVTASDAFGAVSGRTTSLQPNESTTGTRVHTVTSAEIATGSLSNTINVTGTPPVGTAVTDSATANSLFVSPSIAVEKSVSLSTDVNGNGRPDEGDQLTNTYTITNSGDTSLSNLTLQDSLVSTTIAVSAGDLAVGATRSATATQDITAADVTAGVLNGTVVATGSPTVGTDVSATINSTVDFSTFQVASVTVAATSSITLDANSNGRLDAGDQITYGYLITNNGDVSLSGLSLTDTVTGAITLSQTTLASAATLQATSQPHTVTATELVSGSLTNVATVSGMPPSGTTISNTDSVTSNFIQPAVSLTSSAALTTDNNQNGRPDVGDQLTYTYVINNSGDSVLTGITAMDSFGTVTVTNTTLQANETSTQTRQHTITSAEFNASPLVNNVVVTATPASGTNVSAQDSTSTGFTSPGIGVVKTFALTTDTNNNGRPDAGDQLTNTYTITNSGDTSLSNVVLQDTLVTTQPTVQPSTLAAGASTMVTATQTISAADVATGALTGTTTVTGTPSEGTDVSGSTATNINLSAPAISVVVTSSLTNDADGDSVATPGDTVTYTYTVTNNGGQELSSVTLTDSFPAALVLSDVANDGQGTLAVGATETATFAYAVVAADLTAGLITNTASVTGQPPTGSSVNDSASTSIPVGTASIAVTITDALTNDVDGDGLAEVGDTLTYNYTVTNNGPVTLNNVNVGDDVLGTVTLDDAAGDGTGVLGPAATQTGMITHVITQSDLNAGTLTNTATAIGGSPSQQTVTDTATVTRNLCDGHRVSQSIVLLDNTGTAINGPVGLGDTFQLEFRFEDLAPQLATTAVLGGFTDINYDPNLTTPTGITFSNEYPNNRNGVIPPAVAGMLVDVGATDGTRVQPAQNTLIFTLTFTADAVGTANFVTQASDNFLFSVGVFGQDGRFNDQTCYRGLDVQIVNTAQGEFIDTDVNQSGATTPLDVLQIINFLNESQRGSGEDADVESRFDVNRDGKVSPLDVLRVINQIAKENATKAAAESITVTRPSINAQSADVFFDIIGQDDEEEEENLLLEDTLVF